MVGLLFGGGLLVHEMAKLELPGSYDGWRLRVVGKGNKEREVVLPAGARQAVDAWLQVRGRSPGPLIDSLERPGQPLSPAAVARALTRLGKRAKVENVHTHDGR
jgi:integrase/recombinase XerC